MFGITWSGNQRLVHKGIQLFHALSQGSMIHSKRESVGNPRSRNSAAPNKGWIVRSTRQYRTWYETHPGFHCIHTRTILGNWGPSFRLVRGRGSSCSCRGAASLVPSCFFSASANIFGSTLSGRLDPRAYYCDPHCVTRNLETSETSAAEATDWRALSIGQGRTSLTSRTAENGLRKMGDTRNEISRGGQDASAGGNQSWVEYPRLSEKCSRDSSCEKVTKDCNFGVSRQRIHGPWKAIQSLAKRSWTESQGSRTCWGKPVGSAGEKENSGRPFWKATMPTRAIRVGYAFLSAKAAAMWVGRFDLLEMLGNGFNEA